MTNPDLLALANELDDIETDAAGKCNWSEVATVSSALRRLASSDGGVKGEPEPVAWRCFHCDEVFVDSEAACDHFGLDCLTTPACQIAARDGGLVKLIREQEEELRRFRQEDTESYRQFYALGADHRQALIQEEQKGYDRGLADGRADTAPPADAGMREALENGPHYLGAIRQRLERLYEEHPNDPRLREQLSDEVDWVNALYEALTAPGATLSKHKMLECILSSLNVDGVDLNGLTVGELRRAL